jgi:hypothetical protein
VLGHSIRAYAIRLRTLRQVRFTYPALTRAAVFMGFAGVVLSAASSSNFAEASMQAKDPLPNWVMKVPMWRVLPTKQFAVLEEGVVNRRRWAIYAFSNDRPGSSRLPCIENVILRYEHGAIAISNSAPSCGALAPPSKTPVTTEYVLTKVGGVVVGMMLGRSVARVKMHFSTGPGVNMRTKLLSSGQAMKARVRQFRYLAMGIARKACLEASEGVDQSGNTLFQTPPQECVS